MQNNISQKSKRFLSRYLLKTPNGHPKTETQKSTGNTMTKIKREENKINDWAS